MNEVEILFSWDGASVCLCERSETVSQTSGALIAYSYKTVKAADFKFDAHICETFCTLSLIYF